MTKLNPQDTQYLQAAYGFIGSGNHTAAAAELEKVSPACRHHPAVLTARMSVCQGARQWAEGVALAEALIAAEPNQPVYWLQRSMFLHESGRLQEAWDKLLPAAEKFPRFWMVPYSLACYASRLGMREAALEQVRAALKLVDAQAIKQKALAEPDLEPLRDEILKL